MTQIVDSMKSVIDDWDKLTLKQRLKVQGICCNEWTNIKVFILYKDDREGYRIKLQYPTLLITWEHNNKKCRTVISSQVNGKEK
jgi:hypothetical protein